MAQPGPVEVNERLAILAKARGMAEYGGSFRTISASATCSTGAVEPGSRHL